MNDSGLVVALQNFANWRNDLAALVEQISGFSHRLDLLPSGTMLRLEILAREIREERVTISFYGEFARGKSELINALFFYNQAYRFLPSGVGQTTMCPVEICAAEEDRIDLLPMQPSSLHKNIGDLKKSAEHWQRIPMVLTDAEKTQSVLRQIQETQCVPLTEARRFGLCPPLDSARPHLTHCPSCGEGRVKISRWRYALLRLSHPLLAAGLVVIDTPGLNSLGSEADLGLDATRSADASIFVLAADAGVTQSDLQIWEQSLAILSRQRQLVVLNKCDLLCDEMDSPESRAEKIAEQRKNTADRLQVSLDQVIAISAREALIGRLRQKEDRVLESGVEDLESGIANVLIPEKRKDIANNTQAILQRAITDQRFVLEEQSQSVAVEMESMRRLEAQAGDQVLSLLDRQRKIIDNLALDRDQFFRLQEDMKQEANRDLLAPLSLEDLNDLIERAKSDILAVWTTFGIYERFSNFFVNTIAGFDEALARANRLSDKMTSAYRALEQQYALPKLDTLPYVLLPRRAELLALSDYYERFGKRLEIAAYPQGMVVRKAFLNLARQVQNFVLETRRDLLSWVEESFELMNAHLQRCSAQAQEKLLALTAIAESSASIQQRIDALRMKEARIQYEMDELAALQAELDRYFQTPLETPSAA
ncbi:dynamin family protein [Acidithiobacillus acidisediminis]|uniref:dynamin family protein n=1 Tax=Acidithiobacillus acidisediminis TaxID=2937799 RepID=UPI0020109667